jgi:hypothetical protein
VTVPNYLATFRRAARELEEREKSELSEKRLTRSFPYADTLDQLERRCPDYVPPERWHRCLIDAQRFLANGVTKRRRLVGPGPIYSDCTNRQPSRIRATAGYRDTTR